MDLNSRQTRRLFLAGTVSLPMPFPATGVISIEDGTLHCSSGGQATPTTFVIVQDRPGLEHATLRVVLAEYVAAIFFPGEWEIQPDQTRIFRFERGGRVEDFEQGEGFLNPEIDAKKISARLKIDVTNRDSDARGVAFVPEHRPVLSISEATKTAGATGELPAASDCDCECQ